MAFADNSLIFCKMTRVVDGVELSIYTGLKQLVLPTYVETSGETSDTCLVLTFW